MVERAGGDGAKGGEKGKKAAYAANGRSDRVELSTIGQGLDRAQVPCP